MEYYRVTPSPLPRLYISEIQNFINLICVSEIGCKDTKNSGILNVLTQNFVIKPVPELWNFNIKLLTCLFLDGLHIVNLLQKHFLGQQWGHRHEDALHEGEAADHVEFALEHTFVASFRYGCRFNSMGE